MSNFLDTIMRTPCMLHKPAAALYLCLPTLFGWRRNLSTHRRRLVASEYSSAALIRPSIQCPFTVTLYRHLSLLTRSRYTPTNSSLSIMPALKIFCNLTTRPFAGDDLHLVCFVLGVYRAIQALWVEYVLTVNCPTTMLWLCLSCLHTHIHSFHLFVHTELSHP